MSDQDFDKMFEDAANEQDFLFSTDSWDEVSSMLDRNDPKRVDAAFAQGIEGATFEATEAGFESAMSTYAGIKSKRRRKAIAYWSAGVLAILLLSWFSLTPNAKRVVDPVQESPKMERFENEILETTTTANPNDEETENAIKSDPVDQTKAFDETVPEEESIEPIGSETTPKERSINTGAGSGNSVATPLQDADQGGENSPSLIAITAEPQRPDAEGVFEDSQLDSERTANELEEFINLDVQDPVGIEVSETSASWTPQTGEFVLPESKKGVGPEGLNDWGIIVGGRSMRLKDVPDGFDITKYSPEVGVRYARRLNDLWSLETELTGYMIAGTQGSVSFARSVYGMGEATQYRYIESDQSVQLEVPVRLRYRVGGRHFVSGGLSATYMLPTDIRITEEIEEWYGTESLGSETSFGYVYGMRKFNLSWTLGYQFRLSDRLALNTAVNYYMLDRDLLDSEALVPIPWQIRVGVHYSLFR